EVCGAHTITQGGYYQYLSGLNLGTRSWPHYLLPMVYANPALAREILRYTIALQPQVGGQLPYGTGPLCSRIDLGISDDLDFWLLLAAAEYGLGSRDTDFFSAPLPFYDTHAPATAWEHIKLAYQHQESWLGPHGGYLSGSNGDWSDFSAAYLQMTESMLVTAQVAYAYPRLADLADRLGDDAFAAELRTRAAELAQVVRGQWTGMGWYSRGYSGDRQIGVGAIFGEPQPWAILAGIPSAREAATLVSNIRRFLDGVRAPKAVHGPSRIGSSLTPASNDPAVTERSSPPGGVGDNNSNYVGGVWFDVNGWLTWALGELDGVVPGARRRAWSEYTRNTLANHAAQFPDHWAGTISVDDTCYAYYSSKPAQCGNDLYRQYDGQITEQPTWMVMDAIRLAGITPTAAGYTIAPHFPFQHFALRLPQVGIASHPHKLVGYIQPEQAGTIELQVRLPRGLTRRSLETWANGNTVAHTLQDGFVVFSLPAAAGSAADWAVTW
ncbi:MAG: GH36-type glycosyl hydrolase domain-containing protein, partial [Gemmatimonadales bacterium]